MSLNSYPSIYNIGHSAVSDLFTGPVIVEEKVDGSQIGFQVGIDGVLRMRSKGAQLTIEAPADMFKRGVEAVTKMVDQIPRGLTFRGEYLSRPKHNVLCYDRVPANHIIIFDVQTGLEEYMPYDEKAELARSLGFEVVPKLFDGMIGSADQLRSLLDSTSCLGGQKIEGVVIKPRGYDLYGRDKKVLLGKFVSESFKESHRKEWKPSQNKNVIALLEAELKTPARWQKAIIHLKEKGLIEDSPRDIGKLIKEVQEDVLSDSEDRIKSVLFDWAWPQLRRSITGGLPEWYKEQLLESQFEE